MENLDNKNKDVKDTKDVKKKPVQKREKVSIGEYFSGVKTEFKKVVWPTRKELGSFTAVVIIACTFFSLMFAAVDWSVVTALQGILGI